MHNTPNRMVERPSLFWVMIFFEHVMSISMNKHSSKYGMNFTGQAILPH